MRKAVQFIFLFFLLTSSVEAYARAGGGGRHSHSSHHSSHSSSFGSHHFSHGTGGHGTYGANIGIAVVLSLLFIGLIFIKWAAYKKKRS